MPDTVAPEFAFHPGEPRDCAVANNRFCGAETAYREWQKASADPFNMADGLAHIAAGRQDTNLAAGYYRSCLTNCAAGSPEWREIGTRLAALKSSGWAR